MVVQFDDDMKEVCHDIHAATRTYGKQIAKKLHRKVALLIAAESLSHFMSFDNNAHWLVGNRHWEFSIPLSKGYSLILKPIHKESKAPQDHFTMTIVTIEDYHD